MNDKELSTIKKINVVLSLCKVNLESTLINNCGIIKSTSSITTLVCAQGILTAMKQSTRLVNWFAIRQQNYIPLV